MRVAPGQFNANPALENSRAAVPKGDLVFFTDGGGEGRLWRIVPY